MRIVIELDDKIKDFKNADRYERAGLVEQAIHDAIRAYEHRETIEILPENSECDTIIIDSDNEDIITRLR